MLRRKSVSLDPFNESADSVPLPEEPEQPAVEEPNLLATVVNFILEKLSFIRGELVDVQAQLSYENSSPITNQAVEFYAGNEKVATGTTNHQGVASVLWNTSPFAPGVYIVGVDYGGEGMLQPSSSSQEVTIAEPIVEEEVVIPLEQPVAALASSEFVRNIEECQTMTWEEEVEDVSVCTGTYVGMICDDEPINQSCFEGIRDFTYECVVGTTTVQKSRNECFTTGLLVTNDIRSIQLDIVDYVCSSEEVDKVIIVTCDSKFDGNGDGVCTSGESCQRIIVDGASITTSEKNSRDSFVENDEKYFLNEIPIEVLQ